MTPTVCTTCGMERDFPARRGDRIKDRRCGCGGRLARAGRTPSAAARQFAAYYDLYAVTLEGNTVELRDQRDGVVARVPEWPCTEQQLDSGFDDHASAPLRESAHELLVSIRSAQAELRAARRAS